MDIVFTRAVWHPDRLMVFRVPAPPLRQRDLKIMAGRATLFHCNLAFLLDYIIKKRYRQRGANIRENKGDRLD